jgi:hypothetical protein
VRRLYSGPEGVKQDVAHQVVSVLTNRQHSIFIALMQMAYFCGKSDFDEEVVDGPFNFHLSYNLSR